MKRRDILKKLQEAGLMLKEGASHTKVYRGDTYLSAVSRQTEIAETTVRAIEK